jgi:hypothetical protein
MPDNRGSPMQPLDFEFLKDRYDFDQVRYSSAKASKSTTSAAADTTQLDAAADAVSTES